MCVCIYIGIYRCVFTRSSMTGSAAEKSLTEVMSFSTTGAGEPEVAAFLDILKTSLNEAATSVAMDSISRNLNSAAAGKRNVITGRVKMDG